MASECRAVHQTDINPPCPTVKKSCAITAIEMAAVVDTRQICTHINPQFCHALSNSHFIAEIKAIVLYALYVRRQIMRAERAPYLIKLRRRNN